MDHLSDFDRCLRDSYLAGDYTAVVMAIDDVLMSSGYKSRSQHLVWRSFANLAQGRFANAASDLDLAFEDPTFPSGPAAAYAEGVRGVAKLAVGDLNAALLHLNIALAVNPPNRRRGWLRMRAFRHECARDYAAAAGDFERLTEFDPAWADGWKFKVAHMALRSSSTPTADTVAVLNDLATRYMPAGVLLVAALAKSNRTYDAEAAFRRLKQHPHTDEDVQVLFDEPWHAGIIDRVIDYYAMTLDKVRMRVRDLGRKPPPDFAVMYSGHANRSSTS